MKKKKTLLVALGLMCSLFIAGNTVDAASSSHTTSRVGISFNGYDSSVNPDNTDQPQSNVESPEGQDPIGGGKISQGTLPKTNTKSNASMSWLGLLILGSTLVTFIKNSKNRRKYNEK